MEWRVPMGAGKRFARHLFLLMVAGCAFAQEAVPPATSNPAESQAGTSNPAGKEPAANPPREAKKETSSHRSAHHIKVPLEDSPGSELTRAESEIEKRLAERFAGRLAGDRLRASAIRSRLLQQGVHLAELEDVRADHP